MFRPANAVLRRLPMVWKLTLVAGLLFLPLVYAVIGFAGTTQKSISFNDKETSGLDELKLLSNLHSLLAQANANAQQGIDNRTVDQFVDQAVAYEALKDHHQENGDAVVAAAKALPAKISTTDEEGLYVAAYDALTDAAGEVVTNSGLILDPSQDGYYLTNIVAYDIPQVIHSVTWSGTPTAEELPMITREANRSISKLEDDAAFAAAKTTDASAKQGPAAVEEFKKSFDEFTKTGDVQDLMDQGDKISTGAYDALTNLLEERHTTLKHDLYLELGISITGTLIALYFVLALRTSLKKSMPQVEGPLKSLAEGKIVHVVTDDSHDEIGSMTSALQAATNNLAGLLGDLRVSAEQVRGSSNEITLASSALREDSERAADTASEVIQGTTSISEQIGSVAAAVEEFEASIGELAANTARASAAAEESRALTVQATGSVNELIGASEKVNGVASDIQSISSTLRMVALNATIEAARTGEAGRGFAVLAEEIRKLAESAGTCASELGPLLQESATQAQSAQGAMGTMSELVDEVAHQQVNTAQMIEEQRAVAQDISRNVTLTAQDVNSVSANVQRLAESAITAAQVAQQFQSLSESLDGSSDQVSQSAERFTIV